MSRKIRFEDDEKDLRQSDSPDKDITRRHRKQQKLTHEDSLADTKAPASAYPVDPAGALTPINDASIVKNGTGTADGLNFAGLQHGAVDLLRTISPDETPDRNAAVSATRFGLEAVATSLGQMTGNHNTKRKSKLKEKDSSLKFEQDEAKDENGESPGKDADAVEQPENANDADADDSEEDGEATTENSEDAIESNVTGANADSAGETKAQSDSVSKTRPQSDTDPKNKPMSNADRKTKPTALDLETTEEADVTDTGSIADADTTDTADTIASDDTEKPISAASEKPGGKLKFTKGEKTVAKLEKKADKLTGKLDKAQDKLPTKKVKKKQLVFDEKKGKTVSKLTHEKEKVPIGEAKWNTPKDKPMPVKAMGVVTSLTATKVHAKVHQLEQDNVGVKAAHNAELLTESGYRGAKRTANSVYRFHKNRPYRRVAKLEQKSIKNRMKLDYQKALMDNPKLKSNPISRFMQKKAIKRNYAKDLRAAKKAAQTTKKTVGIVSRASNTVTAAIRKNPVFMVKVGLLALIIFLIMSMLSMCVGIFSGTTSFTGAVAYPAEFEDINDASILYTELETDLQIYINNIRSNHPGYDEYRISAGTISHNPFELMSFLSAVYQDFTYAEIESVIRAVFNEQYNLSVVPEVEIRYRTETRHSSWTDGDGNSHSYSYTVQVPYEYHILNVTLTSQPLSSVLAGRMDADQTQHYAALMYSNGARQIVGNPFDFDWLSNVTSLYGYRIHPINGNKEFHWGIDIALPTGTPILAGLTGTVVAVGYDAGGYGNYVVIEDADGIQARYAHCHEIFVTQNQSVELGDAIAAVGNTGVSTGAHLHMEISIDGQRLNPIFFVVTGNEGKSQVLPGNPGGLVIPPYPGEPMDNARFAAIMEEAMLHLGKPYVWGASGPYSFDCSGFVWYVLNQSGAASFGRTTAQGIFNLTTPITKENLQPGDLVFLTGTYSTTEAVTHIAIYIGNGMVVHAGSPVSYASIDSPFWLNHYYASGRLP